MEMLTKFESRSSRAKGVAFHPTQPWILTSLHNGRIQLWDYRMGTLLDRFDGHDGPVRGIAFHPTQPLFVSGGDDYKVNVWNYKSRKLLFSLCGHMDYVRVCTFHHEYPWILSCSDDQTIRIWNWQSRNCIAILTGHSHYVMCAAFHPSEDLIVSASLDQTVRVWDISGLRMKNAAPVSMSLEDQLAQAHNSISNDLFGSTDAIVKFVLEGHDRGVNWCAFHPTLPLILSAGDDRLVKLWRMTASKAWEVDTCRGHFNNVSCCLFHPHQELILSASEDKTIRVWDLNRRTAVQTFRRDNDRFWFITVHPKLNLFAAAHDSGVMVFKLERERPAHALNINTLLYVNKEKSIVSYDLLRAQSTTVASVKHLGSAWLPPRSLSYNPAEKVALLTSSADNGVYELVNVSSRSNSLPLKDNIKGPGDDAIFVARNRFAVFSRSDQTIEIKDLSNKVTKTIQLPEKTRDIFFAGMGHVLLSTATQVHLFDLQQKKIVSSFNANRVKYVVWSNDNSQAALLGKHYVYIVKKNLELITSIHETIRIKSAVWVENNVLLYATLDHLKYALMSGDTGVIKTLESTLYLVKAKGNMVFALNRAAEPVSFEIDPTEYLFKLALLRKDYEQVLHLIQNSNLVGQAIIAYLQKKGYPEIALQFVEDPSTRFELALECGNLETALELARTIDRPEVWSRLASDAMSYGNHKIAEITFQKLRYFEKLSFLYLITGNAEKLQKMAIIAEKRNDTLSLFQNSLYLNEVESRINILEQAGMYPIAYLTAKSNGLEEKAQQILSHCNKTEEEIKLPSLGSAFTTPVPVNETYTHNWPLLDTSHSTFEKSLQERMEQLAIERQEEQESEEEYEEVEQSLMDVVDEMSDLAESVPEEEVDGWEVEDLAPEEAVNDVVDDASAFVGADEIFLWKRNSPLAADHIAAGDFESAMKILNKQVGAINFSPLKTRFLEIYTASRVYLPTISGLDPLVSYVRRNAETAERSQALPFITRNLASIKSHELHEAYRLVKANKILEAQICFRSIIYLALTTVANSEEEADEISALIDECCRYIVALSCELERRRLGEEDTKRALELSYYFASADLQPMHSIIALRLAINASHKLKNYKSASFLGNKLLQLAESGPAAEAANRAITLGDRNPHDAFEIEYDPHVEMRICPKTLTPVYSGDDFDVCSVCGAVYHKGYVNEVCTVCDVGGIGQKGTGRRFFA
ncbi:coatomer alpha subunit Cop1 [Schizosaccharomyces pombe]|uniref:Putative coatomer subunit alpha n=1 Tax=Schizosaccharomyces pombe (strain 972 / ATCC 24843) TaxID=284812 RepID=COPA_SCHPO|nr:putative coatomer alpha subunit protein [Schizosaccharomyces pombe]Q96WV5.1 RecName: Full=Putative coatomer subunit alpha; AltName: Full=Alpha-coat protein; Short=Alpha-COP [Schizosaccharomyces pombe 972h-]CAC38349.1 coatomer alpha subunit (predicted) [Schizosaccharomyces pombe]|eukprot:NP_595279.1 putative coatomer alpha subunit protein [Schizosaccharomyces pombe]